MCKTCVSIRGAGWVRPSPIATRWCLFRWKCSFQGLLDWGGQREFLEKQRQSKRKFQNWTSGIVTEDSDLISETVQTLCSKLYSTNYSELNCKTFFDEIKESIETIDFEFKNSMDDELLNLHFLLERHLDDVVWCPYVTYLQQKSLPQHETWSHHIDSQPQQPSIVHRKLETGFLINQRLWIISPCELMNGLTC